MRIKFPNLFASGRIERENLVIGRSEKKLVLEKDGSGLESGFADQIGLGLRGASVKRPSDFQLRHIFTGDLRSAGIARPAGIAAVGIPTATVVVRFLLLRLRR